MNNKFDDLAKSMAQSVTRRNALKKFGSGLTGIALAMLGLGNKASAQNQLACVHWMCRGHDRNSDWGDVYVCGDNRPHRPNQKCERIGVVACNYCANCC